MVMSVWHPGHMLMGLLRLGVPLEDSGCLRAKDHFLGITVSHYVHTLM